jgi:hypothetical protein
VCLAEETMSNKEDGGEPETDLWEGSYRRWRCMEVVMSKWTAMTLMPVAGLWGEGFVGG